MKVTANGKTFNFPEGTSQEDIGAAVDEYFAANPQPQVSAQPDQFAAVKEQLTGMVQNPVTAPDNINPYTMPQSVISSAKKEAEDFNKKIQTTLSDDQKLAQFELATKTHPLVASLVSAGNEFSALGSGIADLADKNLPAFITNNLSFGDKTPEQRIEARKADMDYANALQEQMDLAHPFSSGVGKALPYMATDLALSPAANAGLRGLGRGAKAVGRSITNKGLPLESRMIANPNKVNTAFTPLVQGVNTSILNLMNSKPLDRARNIMYRELATAPVKGAIEGGANYNSTAGEGAMAGAVGQTVGSFGLLRNLGKPDVVLDSSQREAVRRAMRAGYRATPGMQTGDSILQTMEKGMASDPIYRDLMRQREIANNATFAEMASDAMGMERKSDFAHFSEDDLLTHAADLKKQYGELEAKTTGKFGLKNMDETQKLVDSLEPKYNRDRTTEDINRWNKARLIREEIIQEMSSPIRNPLTGRMETRIYDGAKYQQMRKMLSDRIKEANGAQPDIRLSDVLKGIRDQLDESMERSMGSKGVLQEWKDLNEKYAMTKTVMKKGLDPLGGVDPDKLTKFLMSDAEVERTLTGTGRRIKPLQDIAKVRAMEKQQFGELGWSGSGLETAYPKQSLMKRLVSLPFYTNIPMAKRSGYNVYMSGYPTLTGVIPFVSRNTLSRASRAQEMGNKEYTDMIKGVANTYTDLEEYMSKLLKGD